MPNQNKSLAYLKKLFTKTILEQWLFVFHVKQLTLAPLQQVGEGKNSGGSFASTLEKAGNEVVTHETPEYEIIEVTPYRTEGNYSDFRHPDEVIFSDKLEDDLKRRDFTVNAMAFSKGHVTDIFNGVEDLQNKTLRTVGKSDDRFNEDALRMLRAIRFAVQLDFSIAYETSESILKNSELIKKISAERIRDEFVKIIMSKNPAAGILMLQKFNLLKYIIPELEEGINCEQGGAHIFDVWNHLLQALQHAGDMNSQFGNKAFCAFSRYWKTT